MPFSGTADPGQLAILTAVLEDYCRKYEIEPYTPEWFTAGRRLMVVYSQGAASPGELLTRLERQHHLDS